MPTIKVKENGKWKYVSGGGSGGTGGAVIVDSTLSTTSENPVQNRVITEELNEISKKVEDSILEWLQVEEDKTFATVYGIRCIGDYPNARIVFEGQVVVKPNSLLNTSDKSILLEATAVAMAPGNFELALQDSSGGYIYGTSTSYDITNFRFDNAIFDNFTNVINDLPEYNGKTLSELGVESMTLTPANSYVDDWTGVEVLVPIIGSLEELITNDKSSLVAAINETAKKGVQPDWNETNTASYAYILNKPDIKKDGCKGYGIYKVDTSKNYIVTPYAIPTTEWEVGDRVAFDIGKTYTYGFTIKSFTHKTGYTAIYINEVLPASDAGGDTMYIWNLDKPQSGDIDIGTGAIAQGMDTIAIGKGAVALNRDTKAEGNFSFAANRQTVAGYGAAAFGKGCEALGTHSFASGYGTVAGSDYQRVEGKFNAKDTAGKYAVIVGGGTGLSDTARKNIYTLDWSGNAVFNGSINTAKVVSSGGAEITGGAKITGTTRCTTLQTNSLTVNTSLTVNSVAYTAMQFEITYENADGTTDTKKIKVLGAEVTNG